MSEQHIEYAVRLVRTPLRSSYGYAPFMYLHVSSRSNPDFRKAREQWTPLVHEAKTWKQRESAQAYADRKGDGFEVIEVARPVTEEQARAEDRKQWALNWAYAAMRDGDDFYAAINQMQADGHITLEDARQAFPEAY